MLCLKVQLLLLYRKVIMHKCKMDKDKTEDLKRMYVMLDPG